VYLVKALLLCCLSLDLEDCRGVDDDDDDDDDVEPQ
jgi:hypothetical protein